MKKLIQQIANYNHCEIMGIFWIKDKQVFNIFTLIIFQDGDFIEVREEYLTKKLQKLTKSIKFGILKSVIQIIFDLLNQLSEDKIDSFIDAITIISHSSNENFIEESILNLRDENLKLKILKNIYMK